MIFSLSNALTREYRRNDRAPLLGIIPSLRDEKRSACDAQGLSALSMASFVLSATADVAEETANDESDFVRCSDVDVDVLVNADTKGTAGRHLIETNIDIAEIVFIMVVECLL